MKNYKSIIQQPYCCVPACLQVIMDSKNLPFESQEIIGGYLGLTVPESEKDNYPNAIRGGLNLLLDMELKFKMKNIQ